MHYLVKGKVLYSQFLILLAAATLQLFLCTCSEGLEGPGIKVEEPTGSADLLFRISPVTFYSSLEEVEQQEKIRTMRFVIVDKQSGNIEINQYYSGLGDRDFYTGRSEIDDKFLFTDLSLGEKYVFIFANEESVQDVNSWVYGQSMHFDNISIFFSRAEIGTPGFPGYVNSVYFTLTQQNVMNHGLPYSAFYEIEVKEGKNEALCYLVPVATKFRINLYNYRQESVTLNYIGLSSISQQNYMMGHVGTTDYMKSLPGSNEKLYWIDWLREISELSWNYNEPVWNDQFNNQYGWISDFELPNYSNYEFKTSKTNLSPINVGSPGVSMGPYYLSESKANNFVLSINYPYGLFSSKTISQVIENFHTFFRNSFLDIDIEMSKNGEIEVDYTVCPWNDFSTEINFE